MPPLLTSVIFYFTGSLTCPTAASQQVGKRVDLES